MPWLINRNGLHFLFFPIFSSISEAQLGPVPLPICSTDDKCCWIGERKEKDCRYTCGFCRLGSPSSCCSIIRSVIDTTAADDVDLVSLRTAASVGWLVKYLYTGNPCVFFLSISISNPPFTIYRVSHLLLRWERWGAPSRGGAWPQFETFCQKLWTLDSLQRRSESEMNGGGLEKKRERLATNWRYQIALRAEKILMWLAHVSSGEKLR